VANKRPVDWHKASVNIQVVEPFKTGPQQSAVGFWQKERSSHGKERQCEERDVEGESEGG
jgi:hypothetical protein